MNKKESGYEAHVSAALDSYEYSDDVDNSDPYKAIGQGVISGLLAIAAAVHELAEASKER
jgi:hypothetical protein